MDLSVLTVTWNSVEHVAAQIEAVRAACEGISFEHLIADNASNDGTVTVIRQKFPDFKLKAYREDVAYAFANNELAKEASGDFFLLLNPDMEPLPGSFSKLLALAKARPSAGIISCRLLKKDGGFNTYTAPRHFPKLFDQLVILLKLHHIFPKLLDNYLWKDFDSSKEQVVDSVQGSFMLVQRELYKKLGKLFDQRYYIWFEDVDLCREAKKLGYEVWYTPEISCVDFGGASFKNRPLLWKQRQLTKSMFEYFKKWGRLSDWVLVGSLRPFVIFSAWVHDLFFV